MATEYEVVEGRVVEKVREDVYRLLYVHYDEERGDYLTISVELRVNVSGEYVVNSEIPSYLKFEHVGDGSWRLLGMSGPLGVWGIRDPNDVDREVVNAIAAQVEEYAERHGLSGRKVVELVCDVVSLMVPLSDPVPPGPVDVKVFENGTIVKVKLNVSDSLAKRILLEGGRCWQHAVLAAWILKDLGFDTGLLVYHTTTNGTHAVLAVLGSNEYEVLEDHVILRWNGSERVADPFETTIGSLTGIPKMETNLENDPELKLWLV